MAKVTTVGQLKSLRTLPLPLDILRSFVVAIFISFHIENKTGVCVCDDRLLLLNSCDAHADRINSN